MSEKGYQSALLVERKGDSSRNSYSGSVSRNSCRNSRYRENMNVFNEKNELKTVIDKYEDDNFVVKPEGLTGGKGVKVGGIHFKGKEEGYEYKTIIFEEVKKINYQELYKIPEIKQYLDQGYAVYHEFFNNHICDSTNVYCTEDFYGIVLYKSYTEDYYNIIFNQEFTTTTELDEYLSTNEEYQQKIKEGYELYDKYYNYEYASSNSKYMRTFGIILSKNSGKKIKKNVYQHETAIGAHGDEKGKPDPIEIGVTYLGWEIYYREDGNLDLTDTPPGEYLTQYQETLKKSGYNIDDIYLLTMDDLLNLLIESTALIIL